MFCSYATKNMLLVKDTTSDRWHHIFRQRLRIEVQSRLIFFVAAYALIVLTLAWLLHDLYFCRIYRIDRRNTVRVNLRQKNPDQCISLFR